MANNFFTLTIWQNFLQIFWWFFDTLYRVCVRLLYHSKLVGVLALFIVIIFVTSGGFFISFFYSNHSDHFSKNNPGDENNLHGFYAMDVGQGDALLYVTKEDQTFLIDTGKPNDGVVQELEKILGKYKKKIDVILLTHPDSDHVGEINKILSAYNVGLILYSPIYDARIDSKKAIDEIKNKVKNKSTLVLPVFAGESLSFSSSENTYFLSPSVSSMTTFTNKKELSEDNYFSVVCLIENKDAIFAMADAPQKIEKVLITNSTSTSSTSTSSTSKDIFNSTSSLANIAGKVFNRKDFDKIILKVGHHGSKTSSAPEFIQKLSPTDAVLSYGINNRYGHPNKEVLDIFSSILVPKIKIHRTISGTVYFSE